MVPSSVANRNVAGDPSINVNAPLDANELNTCPVGAAGPLPGLGGAMVTGETAMEFSVTPLAVTLSMLARPEKFSDIQNGLPGP
jgi:hypothetical protein